MDVDDQKVAVRPEEANERGDARTETKNRHKRRRKSLQRVLEAQKSNPTTLERNRESVSQERGKRRSVQRVLGARSSNPIEAGDG